MKKLFFALIITALSCQNIIKQTVVKSKLQTYNSCDEKKKN
jgi:hypothetical protein